MEAIVKNDLQAVKRITKRLSLAVLGLPEPDLGATVVHLAADRGHTQALWILLNRGLDPNARDFYGMTPLMAAARNGRWDIVWYLRISGADLTIRDHEGRTAAHHVRPCLALEDVFKRPCDLELARSLLRDTPTIKNGQEDPREKEDGLPPCVFIPTIKEHPGHGPHAGEALCNDDDEETAIQLWGH